MELHYLLTNMEATAVVGYAEIERAPGYGVEATFYAYDTNGDFIFKRKGQTPFQKVANGKGMRVMARGYFGITPRPGMTAPETMVAKMNERREPVSA